MPRSAWLLAALLLVLSAGPVRAQCPGDLNGDGVVTIEEIITMVNAALYGCPVLGTVPSCPEDLNGDGVVTVDEILRAVNAALSGCPTPTTTPVPSTPTATATETTTPTPSATLTASPTAPPSACPYTFLDDTLSQSVSCDFIGPFNPSPNCPNDLDAGFVGDGSILGIGIGTEELITFVATVTSATSASLFGYTIGNDTTIISVGGTIELQQNGHVLVIAPDSPPFDLADTIQCAFVQYTGTYAGVFSTQAVPAAPPRRQTSSVQPASFRLR